MLRLPVDRAAPGMVLALPVFHPENPGHVLLKPGAAVDGPSIRKMIELRITHLCIRYPPTEFLLRYASPAILAEHGRLTCKLAECFDTVVHDMHAELEFLSYAGAVRSFIARLMDDPDSRMFLGSFLNCGPSLLTHSANVCYLSLLMGLKLDGYLVSERMHVGPRRAQNIENLGVGALFHDIGMLRLAPEVMEHWLRTGDENDPQWQRHALLGYDTVRGKIAPTAATIVLHHHQRQDGSGFPKRVRLNGPPRALSGSEIHVFARIVALAEVFERLRNPPVLPGATDDRRIPNVRALKLATEVVRAGKLDPVVFKALLAVVPAYTPGTLVMLSDGQACVVTGWDPAHPCRPVVNPLADGGLCHINPGQPAAPRQTGNELGPPIDLRWRTGLQIVSSDGHDVAADNFDPRTPGEFDLRYQFAGGRLIDESDPIAQFARADPVSPTGAPQTRAAG